MWPFTSSKPAPAPAKPAENKPKPCCVCKEEKAARDECFLYGGKSPETECLDKIQAYKKCMASFGFEV